MPNKELKSLLKDYVKDMFLTPALIQSTRMTIRKESFGDPDTNVMFIPALTDALVLSGQDFEVYIRNKSQVMSKCSEIALTQYVDQRRLKGFRVLREEKVQYMKEWKLSNKNMLTSAGLGDDCSDNAKFVSGLFLSIKQARHTVPLLQSVFQADAAHMNFGKYTLYSCYGTTANNNTFPIAIAVIFGNEDKEGWTRFWQFVKEIHPCIAAPNYTIITDQQKGLIPALSDVLPEVVNFFCSFHRRQNIMKHVKGGSGPYSCMWLYNMLIKCKLSSTLDKLKFDHSGNMQVNALRYINQVNDYQQFPAARCVRHPDACMFQKTASSSVEAMNHANHRVRDRSAVDPMNSLILLLHLEDNRYRAHRDAAWSNEDFLTPYGHKLINDAFKSVDYREYQVAVDQEGGFWSCQVNRVVSSNHYTCQFPMVPVNNSHFGTCTCGVPKVDGIPCNHMVAVVKGNRLEGFNENNIMPYWFHTSHWRSQYPMGTSVGATHVNLSRLLETNRPIKEYKLCPGFSGASKSGRPKNNKRLKSMVEIACQKKKTNENGGPKKSVVRGKKLVTKISEAASLQTNAVTKKARAKTNTPNSTNDKSTHGKGKRKTVGLAEDDCGKKVAGNESDKRAKSVTKDKNNEIAKRKPDEDCIRKSKRNK